MIVSLLGSAVLKHLMIPSHLSRLSLARTKLSLALVAVRETLPVCALDSHDMRFQSHNTHSIPPERREGIRPELL